MAYRAPIYSILYALAASALLLGLATDIVYVLSADFIWVDMSDWLVSIGAVVGFLALIFGIVEVIVMDRLRRPGWAFGLISILAWIVAVANMLIHSRDGLTSVLPAGLILSAVTSLLLLAAWWTHRTVVIKPIVAEIVT